MANLHPVMLVYQLVVTVIIAVTVICGGELVVWIPIGFLGSPYERDCYERGYPENPKPSRRTTNLPLVDRSRCKIFTPEKPRDIA